MEAFVALLRNGLCILNDLLPKESLIFHFSPSFLLDKYFNLKGISYGDEGFSPSKFLIMSLEKWLYDSFDLIYVPIHSFLLLLLQHFSLGLNELRNRLESINPFSSISIIITFLFDLTENYLQFLSIGLSEFHVLARKVIPDYINFLSKLNHLPFISIAISCLQFAAVLFGVLGGIFSLIQAIKMVTASITWANTMEEVKSTINGEKKVEKLLAINILEDSIRNSMVTSWSNMIDSLMNVVIGICFIPLSLFTIDMIDLETVMLSLVVMEIILIVFMLKSFANCIKKRWTRQILSKFTYSVSSTSEKKLCDTQYLITPKNRSSSVFFPFMNQSFNLSLVEADEGKSKECTSESTEKIIEEAILCFQSFNATLSRKSDDDEENFLMSIANIANQDKKLFYENFLDFSILFMDWIAFWGYGVCCIVYYLNDEEQYQKYFRLFNQIYPGNNVLDWWGNFIGDVMWTIQPLVILQYNNILYFLLNNNEKILNYPGRQSNHNRKSDSVKIKDDSGEKN